LTWAWPAEAAAIPGKCWTRPKAWASAHAVPASPSCAPKFKSSRRRSVRSIRTTPCTSALRRAGDAAPCAPCNGSDAAPATLATDYAARRRGAVLHGDDDARLRLLLSTKRARGWRSTRRLLIVQGRRVGGSARALVSKWMRKRRISLSDRVVLELPVHEAVGLRAPRSTRRRIGARIGRTRIRRSPCRGSAWLAPDTAARSRQVVKLTPPGG
jgi:hypothetical protein